MRFLTWLSWLGEGCHFFFFGVLYLVSIDKCDDSIFNLLGSYSFLLSLFWKLFLIIYVHVSEMGLALLVCMNVELSVH